MRLALELGLCAVVLPELEALRGVEQSRYHTWMCSNTRWPHSTASWRCNATREPTSERARAGAERLLAAPLADLRARRRRAFRRAHARHRQAADAGVAPDAGSASRHDASARRSHGDPRAPRAAEPMRAHVAALTLNHLRLGFLVPQAPLHARALPLSGRLRPRRGDVTLLSVADRVATRGAAAGAIDATSSWLVR